ncbi:hypothetical protein BaRGS_00023696 [Batillaria attramentaria]|uniref:Transposase n=1 Tax=Batillaria attramentaria TaxID=370345 RepID=A0ABD0KDG2_9CAEN
MEVELTPLRQPFGRQTAWSALYIHLIWDVQYGVKISRPAKTTPWRSRSRNPAESGRKQPTITTLLNGLTSPRRRVWGQREATMRETGTNLPCLRSLKRQVRQERIMYQYPGEPRNIRSDNRFY